MGDAQSHLGAKLGPRLAGLMSDATVATRRALFDTEHTLRVASARTVVDWMGLELGQVMGPLTDPILKRKVLPPDVQKVMENITSGKNQWQALAGMAFGSSGVSGTLGTIMSNYLAPTSYAAVGADPLLVPGVSELVQLAARGVGDYGGKVLAARWQGINENWFEQLVTAARTQPDLTTMIELWRRHQIGAGEIVTSLQLAGFTETWARHLLTLAKVPLSPAEAALAVVRGVLTLDQAQEAAAQSGVDVDDLGVMVANTGDAPAVEELLSLWRRGHVDDATLERGIRQSRLRDEWIPTIKQLGVMPPSPAEVLESLVKGQTDRATAQRRYTEAGGDPTWFETALTTAGASPSPVELGTLAKRGIIPWDGEGPDVVSFRQGFLEGHWRNKWEPAFRSLAEYLPPPRTITAMVHEGSITRERALVMLQQTGLSAELAAAYVSSGSHQKTAKHRELAATEVETLYEDKAIDRGKAVALLEALGYDEHEAGLLLYLADVRRYRKFVEQAIGRVHTEYTAHHIDRSTASAELDRVGVPSAQRDDLLKLWAGEREIRTKTLTWAQVHTALKKEVITEEEAIRRAIELGYTEKDAKILVQI